MWAVGVGDTASGLSLLIWEGLAVPHLCVVCVLYKEKLKPPRVTPDFKLQVKPRFLPR